MGRANNSQNGAESSSSGNGWGALLSGFAIGALGGVTLALLTAPKSGSETRTALQRGAKDVPERVSEVLDDSLDLYASFLNYCQLSLEEQTLRFKRAVAAGKLAAAKKREEIEYEGTSLQHR